MQNNLHNRIQSRKGRTLLGSQYSIGPPLTNFDDDYGQTRPQGEVKW